MPNFKSDIILDPVIEPRPLASYKIKFVSPSAPFLDFTNTSQTIQEDELDAGALFSKATFPELANVSLSETQVWDGETYIVRSLNLNGTYTKDYLVNTYKVFMSEFILEPKINIIEAPDTHIITFEAGASTFKPSFNKVQSFKEIKGIDGILWSVPTFPKLSDVNINPTKEWDGETFIVGEPYNVEITRQRLINAYVSFNSNVTITIKETVKPILNDYSITFNIDAARGAYNGFGHTVQTFKETIPGAGIEYSRVIFPSLQDVTLTGDNTWNDNEFILDDNMVTKDHLLNNVVKFTTNVTLKPNIVTPKVETPNTYTVNLSVRNGYFAGFTNTEQHITESSFGAGILGSSIEFPRSHDYEVRFDENYEWDGFTISVNGVMTVIYDIYDTVYKENLHIELVPSYVAPRNTYTVNFELTNGEWTGFFGNDHQEYEEYVSGEGISFRRVNLPRDNNDLDARPFRWDEDTFIYKGTKYSRADLLNLTFKENITITVDPDVPERFKVTFVPSPRTTLNNSWGNVVTEVSASDTIVSKPTVENIKYGEKSNLVISELTGTWDIYVNVGTPEYPEKGSVIETSVSEIVGYVVSGNVVIYPGVRPRKIPVTFTEDNEKFSYPEGFNTRQFIEIPLESDSHYTNLRNIIFPDTIITKGTYRWQTDMWKIVGFNSDDARSTQDCKTLAQADDTTLTPVIYDTVKDIEITYIAGTYLNINGEGRDFKKSARAEKLALAPIPTYTVKEEFKDLVQIASPLEARVKSLDGGRYFYTNLREFDDKYVTESAKFVLFIFAKTVTVLFDLDNSSYRYPSTFNNIRQDVYLDTNANETTISGSKIEFPTTVTVAKAGYKWSGKFVVTGTDINMVLTKEEFAQMTLTKNLTVIPELVPDLKTITMSVKEDARWTHGEALSKVEGTPGAGVMFDSTPMITLTEAARDDGWKWATGSNGEPLTLSYADGRTEETTTRYISLKIFTESVTIEPKLDRVKFISVTAKKDSRWTASNEIIKRELPLDGVIDMRREAIPIITLTPEAQTQWEWDFGSGEQMNIYYKSGNVERNRGKREVQFMQFSESVELEPVLKRVYTINVSFIKDDKFRYRGFDSTLQTFKKETQSLNLSEVNFPGDREIDTVNFEENWSWYKKICIVSGAINGTYTVDQLRSMSITGDIAILPRLTKARRLFFESVAHKATYPFGDSKTYEFDMLTDEYDNFTFPEVTILGRFKNAIEHTGRWVTMNDPNRVGFDKEGLRAELMNDARFVNPELRRKEIAPNAKDNMFRGASGTRYSVQDGIITKVEGTPPSGTFAKGNTVLFRGYNLISYECLEAGQYLIIASVTLTALLAVKLDGNYDIVEISSGEINRTITSIKNDSVIRLKVGEPPKVGSRVLACITREDGTHRVIVKWENVNKTYPNLTTWETSFELIIPALYNKHASINTFNGHELLGIIHMKNAQVAKDVSLHKEVEPVYSMTI